MHDFSKKLEGMGLNLNKSNPPAGSYVPHIIHNDLVFISGQTCKKNGQLIYTGKIGKDLDLDQGIEAARLCALNLIGQVYNACNEDWRSLEQCLKLTVFVNCDADFGEIPAIADGASHLLHEVFGNQGKHTRSAVGAGSLPGGAAVEIEGIFALHQ